MEPHEYPRRVLLCVSGISPQIITETLYALAVAPEGHAPFVPTEIRILTTSEGAKRARQSLLDAGSDMLGRLCRDYALPPIDFSAGHIEVLPGPDGLPMADIRTPAENESAADHITRRVAELCSDPTAAVHASIAGGRKTMGFYMGYALSLFARSQDRLSHVLVSEGFDGRPDFYYKPRVPELLVDRASGRTLSTDHAEIHLAMIPIVSLRSGELEALGQRRVGFAEAVAKANRSLEDSELRLIVSERRAFVRGMPLALNEVQFMVLHWFAERRLRGAADNGGSARVSREWFRFKPDSPNSKGVWKELFALASRHYGPMSKAQNALEKVFDSDDPKKWKSWIGPHLTRIEQAFESAIGVQGRDRFGIASEGGKFSIVYHLRMPPESIRIER